ncbi:hypothetical protein M9H77_10066 [Catharanthus roseus]|uniref:Uncharacterized protein n=1 Tax=Catharanthus roseus TaxID=4058 RepID=A0ACC0C2J8_CATRO|nr:hypothetical protein M9H77_10066 [Catharanthus roseus]
MELLKLSKFKFQLRALISEVHQLKERERSAKEQLEFSLQKQKQSKEEFNRRITELHAELDLSNDLRQKLERKVSCLVMENDLLENKQKELKETICNLLQSREGFVNIYEEHFAEMKKAVEAKDKKIEVLSEKIKSHSLLVDAIEKEAFSIKKVVDNAECIMKGKEEVVVGLKRKVEAITKFERLFIEKINNLESKLKKDEDELKRKDKVILGLEAQLEAAKLTNDFQPRMDELQKALSAKELLTKNLIMEKKALHSELAHLGFVMGKIQEAVSNMDEESRRTFSSVLEGEEECATIKENEDNSFRDAQRNEDDCHRESLVKKLLINTAPASCENPSEVRSLKEDNKIESCVTEEIVESGGTSCSGS